MNAYVKRRLDGLLENFRAAQVAGGESAAAVRGVEREAFLSAFLSLVLPPVYRVGTGEITDAAGCRSGQIDIVVEMPWAPSFGFPGSPARLYLAESVGLAIEVKSNLADQWDEVDRSSKALAPLTQRLSGHSTRGAELRIHSESDERIPTLAVGYTGWKKTETVEQRLLASELDGLLILDVPLFVESDRLEAYERAAIVSRDPSLTAHQLIGELSETGETTIAIADRLNTEGRTSARTHFGDEQYLPTVPAGLWTEDHVRASLDVLGRKATCYRGTEALLAFVRRVHTELSKRSGMSVDLDRYA